MAKSRLAVLLLAALELGAGSAVDALAASPHSHVKYVPPPGFDGHLWGELRATFERLPKDPIGVGAAFTHPLHADINFICTQTLSSGTDGCDLNTVIHTLRQTNDGGGFYVLSEYTLESQGFRFGSSIDGVLLHPVVYQFCANWDGTRKVAPENFEDLNKFCGVRLMFHSETREQLRQLPADIVTNYDRILEKLLEKYGRPAGFTRRGRVLIEAVEGESNEARDRKFSIWRWCPALDRTVHPTCTASVVLSLDLSTGVGTLLYSTPLLWEYAYVRQNRGFKGDPLFKMLHAHPD